MQPKSPFQPQGTFQVMYFSLEKVINPSVFSDGSQGFHYAAERSSTTANNI